ncbi:MAG: hypothetical protein K8L99_27700 [Anaerolineae bacterium]|nr:hypothetical protein [Anaerolineae bacterium]
MISRLKSFIQRLLEAVLNRIWFVHPRVVLLAQVPPDVCMEALLVAAKPSSKRLHLRNLFLDGRRYHLHVREKGFHMTSNSKIPWLYRRRTRLAAVLSGNITPTNSGSRLILTARMTPLHLLDIFLIPLWIGVLVIFGPLAPEVKLIALGALLLLSWLSHWYSAVLQAVDMIYFVQTVLEDWLVTEIPTLPASADQVIHAPDDFREAWERFYEAHKKERES